VIAVAIAALFAFVVASFFVSVDADDYAPPERTSRVPINASTVASWLIFLTSLAFAVVLLIAQCVSRPT
jgi:hypothetical protein